MYGGSQLYPQPKSPRPQSYGYGASSPQPSYGVAPEQQSPPVQVTYQATAPKKKIDLDELDRIGLSSTRVHQSYPYSPIIRKKVDLDELDDLMSSQKAKKAAAPPIEMRSAVEEPLNPTPKPRRDVADHERYSFDVLKDKRVKELGQGGVAPQFINLTKPWYYQSMVALQAYFLFNGIITLMALAQNYGVKNDVDYTLVSIAAYSPMAFFFLYIFVFNNYYSQRVYYHYLEWSAIVDFRDSSLPVAWVTNVMPLLFLLTFLAYIGYMFFYFISTGAPIRHVWVFMSNAFVGVFLFWYRHQSIESKFISLSDYIQSFPDETKTVSGNIDRESMDNASKRLEHSELLHSGHMCYSGYMRDWWLGDHNRALHPLLKGMHFLAIFAIIAGAVVAAFFTLENASTINQEDWEFKIKSCVGVCLNFTQGNCTGCLRSCRVATDNPLNTVCNGLEAMWAGKCSQWCK